MTELPQTIQVELSPDLARLFAYFLQFLTFHFLGIGMVLCCHFPLNFTRR